ncbi:site-specific integrase [uncultured Deinococcus sp.]|uniref:tyrosine-type recombinase/integrase n=1 Tax=uncultured Deinococcus sp. TaxID=158789 RepID=UPI00258DEF46|nr:site-specific integrase [uncultured Deinococcus sp.]
MSRNTRLGARKQGSPAGKRKLGSVFQRKQDGRWAAAVTLPSGKRITRYVKPDQPDPERAAHELLARLITEVGSGELAPPSEMTVERWLGEYLRRANRGKAAATVKDRAYSAAYLTEAFGKVRLERLSAQQIQRWADTAMHPVKDALKAHRKYEGQPLSHRAKLKALQLLRSALTEAVGLGHIPRNPAVPVRLERQPSRPKGVAWTPEQAQAFLAANEQTTLAPLWRLALQTGGRLGELLALKVDDYQPVRRLLRIERTLKYGGAEEGKDARRTVGPPKTERAVRAFPLPTDALATVEAALARRERLREAAGALWQEEGWLFPSETGRIIPHGNAHRSWREALARAPEVPVVRPHDLRHTFISLALRRGVKPEVVARMVGHSSPLITLRIYRQVFEDEFDEAREMLSGLV